MKPIDKFIKSLKDLRLPHSMADFRRKLEWSFLLVQSLLWAIVLRAINFKKEEPDGSKRDFTVEDLKKILAPDNEDSPDPMDDDSRLRGMNPEIFNNSGFKTILDFLLRAVINSRTFFLHTDIQKSPYPGYILMNRELFYTQSIESSSKGIEFKGVDYNKMPNVLSVWFLLNPPASLKNRAVCAKLTLEEEWCGKDTPVSIPSSILTPTPIEIMYTVGIGNYSSSCCDLVRLADLICGTCPDPQERITEFKALLKEYGWKETAGNTAEPEVCMETASNIFQYVMDLQKEAEQAVEEVKAKAAEEVEAEKVKSAKEVDALKAQNQEKDAEIRKLKELLEEKDSSSAAGTSSDSQKG